MYHSLPRRSREEDGAMSEQDEDIEWLKANVSCAVLLERLPPVWRLDRAESSRAQPQIPPRRRRNRHRQP